jgi:hypothetical protein
MSKLAEVLKRFNRKERNLLFRAVLGDERKPLSLSDEFREDVHKALGIEIQRDAWWSTDYHISWLAGALTCFTEGDACLIKPRPNRPFCDHPSTETSPQLIEQNQEDVDLVIASGLDLILIEAKAFDKFDDPPLQSKLERLDLLWEEYLCITKQKPVVQFHFLLISPTEPKNLTVTWPKWTRKNTEIPWIELNLPSGEPILEVNRCDSRGKKSAEGDHWRIVEYRPGHRARPKQD